MIDGYLKVAAITPNVRVRMPSDACVNTWMEELDKL